MSEEHEATAPAAPVELDEETKARKEREKNELYSLDIS
ncbi:DUF397 domain-containing protein, partial [Streptomyces sp. SID11233]|nr:DUF397 domain-containing protein [Streptomyces sp. SID11233]